VGFDGSKNKKGLDMTRNVAPKKIWSNGATFVVYQLIEKGRLSSEISKLANLPRWTVSKAIKRLEALGCIRRVHKVGNAWMLKAIRRPSIVAPQTGSALRNRPYYLPHKVFGTFDVLRGEPSSRKGVFLGDNRGELRGGVVQMDFLSDGCKVQYTLGGPGRASLLVDVPEKRITGATID
jgi:hypothetical protein